MARNLNNHFHPYLTEIMITTRFATQSINLAFCLIPLHTLQNLTITCTQSHTVLSKFTILCWTVFVAMHWGWIHLIETSGGLWR